MMRRMLLAGMLVVLLIACSEQDDETITIAPSVEVGTEEGTDEATEAPTVESTQEPTPTAEPTIMHASGTPHATAGKRTPGSLIPEAAIARFGMGRFDQMILSPDRT